MMCCISQVVTCPNASFTDLAEIVSRIEPVTSTLINEEPSDEYQTDYDEEAVESALSDFEAVNAGSQQTEGEETADNETDEEIPVHIQHRTKNVPHNARS
ncbi:patatin-like phospholipase domain-containing protein 7 isoform X1 [Mastacembelus armatus]|uniref:patatin-like phospholipase domain-containing protein 7 n=1 Tax=Mastacembelus armatus TaxID=205130 RepID=UPI001436B404|nr:patatin-like phospholipase domain-containing protein 7 [Mastacembelus armatus]XP_033181011.1 patatin-like phospholipase domain-containing protein 7 isoform X1 [Mastacembelus armatus]